MILTIAQVSRGRASHRSSPRGSGVPVEDGRLSDAAEALLDGAGPRLPYDTHVIEVIDGGAHDLLQVAEPRDDALDDRLGQPGDLRQEAEAAGLQALVEVELLVRQVQRSADRLEVEQVLGAQV